MRALHWLALSLSLFTLPAFAQDPAPQSPELPDAPSSIAIDVSHSIGHDKIFGSDEWVMFNGVGFTYYHKIADFIGARVEYGVGAEVVVLNEPCKQANGSGAPLTACRKYVPGAGISPVEFRFIWRHGKMVEPFTGVKAYVDGFNTGDVMDQHEGKPHYGFKWYLGLRFGGGRNHGEIECDTRHVSNGNTGRYNPGTDFQECGVGYERELGGRASNAVEKSVTPSNTAAVADVSAVTPAK